MLELSISFFYAIKLLKINEFTKTNRRLFQSPISFFFTIFSNTSYPKLAFRA